VHSKQIDPHPERPISSPVNAVLFPLPPSRGLFRHAWTKKRCAREILA
jgi:hypothetical protein